MIRKYHNQNLQTNLGHREEEPHNNHETPGSQTKQSNQLSLPHQDDLKQLEWTHSNAHQNIEQAQNSTMGVTNRLPLWLFLRPEFVFSPVHIFVVLTHLSHMELPTLKIKFK